MVVAKFNRDLLGLCNRSNNFVANFQTPISILSPLNVLLSQSPSPSMIFFFEFLFFQCPPLPIFVPHAICPSQVRPHDIFFLLEQIDLSKMYPLGKLHRG